MKLILTTIAISLLYPALMAQDTIPAIPAQDTVPVVVPAAVVEPDAQAAADQAAQAQPEKQSGNGAWKQKMYYGGYVNFSLGSYTSIGVEPMVGYKIIPRLSLGLKIRYDYIQDKRYAETYSYSNYGGSLFTRLSVIKQLYLHAEYAAYNYQNYSGTDNEERIWVPFLFLGAGFRQPLGGRAALNAQVLFDVLNSDKSPYSQWAPFYSVGISAGF
jgi:hypothetical protein